MMYGFLLLLHLVGIVVWVGGMFFAAFCLHPSLAALAGKDKVALMSATLGRFFNYVMVAIVLIWISGTGLLAGTAMRDLPIGWHLMLASGVLMTVIFAYLYLGLFRPARKAIAGNDMAVLPGFMGRIRSLVLVNLALGGVAVAGVTLWGGR